VLHIRRLVLPSLLIGLIAAFVLQVQPFSPAVPFRLLVQVRTDTEGRARLTWNSDKDTRTPKTDATLVTKGDQLLSFNLPDSTIEGFRLSPLDREGNVEIGAAAVIGPASEIVAVFPAATYVPTRQDLEAKLEGKFVRFTSQPGDAVVFVAKQPLKLTRRWLPIEPATAALQLAGAAIAALLVLILANRIPTLTRVKWSRSLARMRDVPAARPAATLLMAAVLAVKFQ
jgi:hypothetical protein